MRNISEHTNDHQAMSRDGKYLTILATVGAACIALLMATIIYYRASFRITPEFLDVMVWQLVIWAPWVVLAPLIRRLERRYELRSMQIVRWIVAHTMFALAVSGTHALWYFLISDRLSPYYGVVGTKYGAFAYFFIFWFVIDLLIYWILVIFLRERDSYRLYVEKHLELECLERSMVGRLQFLRVNKRGKQRVIQVNQIDWIEAKGYYAALHVGSDVFLVRRSLKALVDLLGCRQFIRVHRSTVVNVNFIETIDRSAVTLGDGTSRSISRSGRINLLNGIGTVSTGSLV